MTSSFRLAGLRLEHRLPGINQSLSMIERGENMVRLHLKGKYSLADFSESFIAYIKGEDHALTFSAQHVPLRVTVTRISVSRCSNKIIRFSGRLESGRILDCRYHLEQGWAKTYVSPDFYYHQIYKNCCKYSPVFTEKLPSNTIEIIAGPSREELLENFIARLESKRRKACELLRRNQGSN